MIASDDGQSLLTHTESDLTVGEELNKLADNVGVGRDMSGIHFRSDYWESLLLAKRSHAMCYLCHGPSSPSEPRLG